MSAFLLRLSGLAGKRVLRTQRDTGDVSFRDLARLVIVDEVQIQSTGSPIYSGQHLTRTREERVFRLILSGQDDSSVISKPSAQLVKGRKEGKAEMLDELLAMTRRQLEELNVTATLEDLRDQRRKLRETVDAAVAEVATEQKYSGEMEDNRRAIWRRLREVESRENVLSELQTRFVLLRSQYDSDLRRLEAISEAGGRLAQMNEDRCPVCGAIAEHHSREHQHEKFDPTEVAVACKAEAEKTAASLNDLAVTIGQTSKEVGQLKEERAARQSALQSITADIQKLLQPRLQAALQNLKEAQARRDSQYRGLQLLERVAELEELKKEITSRKKKADPEPPLAPAMRAGDAESFVAHVQQLLGQWHFPKLTKVLFSDAEQDIVISGRSRDGHGKGVRAITHAAFNLGLLHLCEAEGRPFPAFVLIDSPLVVYREPDSEEGAFPPDVKPAFYRSLKSEFADSQVIILENDGPPEDVAADTNVIVFSGSKAGRSGFIPSA